MKKYLKLIFSILILVAILVLPYFVFATGSSTLDNLSAVATGGGYQATGNSLSSAAGIIIGAALGLLGIIFIILIIIGGYLWMTAGGNEQKVEKARNYVQRAIIGLVITLSSWAIWNYIIKRLVG